MLRRAFRLFSDRPVGDSRPRRGALHLEALEDRCTPATLFVDPNVAATGSIFTTIRAAVAAAHSGDTIKVVAGAYRETVDVDKSLTILGGQVRVAGEPTGPSQMITPILGRKTGFVLEANNITIKGFEFFNPTAIDTTDTHSGYHILNNRFHNDKIGVHLVTLTTPAALTTTISGNVFFNDGQGPAIQNDILIDGGGARNVVINANAFNDGNETDETINVGGTSNVNIQINNNTFRNENGILMVNATNFKINDNLIFSPNLTAIVLDGGVSKSQVARNTVINTRNPPRAGVILGNQTVATLDTDNKIADNSFIGVSVGVQLNPALNTTISGNNVVNSLIAGISVLNGSGGSKVTGNTVANSAGDGIIVKNLGNAAVTSNVCSHNNRGIFVSDATGVTLTSNSASFNVTEGVELFNVSQCTLTRNSASFNTTGFDVEGSTNNTLNANVAELNGSFGFILSNNSDSNKLTLNKALRNQNDGFAATINSDSDTFIQNVAFANRIEGFELAGNGHVLTGNSARNNAIDGIAISGSGATLQGNTVADNARNGFFLGIDSSTVSGNSALRNGQDGLDLGGQTNTISGNTVRDNGRHGIDVTGASHGNKITGNTSLNNGIFVGGFDLFDESLTTTQNSWTKNIAVTRNPAGLG